jgi:hypothetical protein
MGFQVVTELGPDFLRITASGEYSLDDLYALIEQIRTEADKAVHNVVLVDARGILGEMSDADQFFAGRKVAEMFGSRIKVAVIRNDHAETKLGEAVAVSRGARFLITNSEEEALNWLLAD